MLLEKIIQLIFLILRTLGIDKFILPQNFSDLLRDVKYFVKINNALTLSHHINRFLPKHSFPPHIVLFSAIYNVFRKFSQCDRAKKLPKNVALVYESPVGNTVPNVSPYVLKLETYLRMANVNYEIDSNFIRSKEGKVPWVLYNGLEIADSQRCIEYFNKKLTIDFDQHLTESEKATAHAFRILVDDHLIWPLLMMRYVYGGLRRFHSVFQLNSVQRIIYTLLWPYFYCRISRKAKRNGIGYRTRPEVYEIASKDLQALSSFLGNKSFFMGEQISEVDPAIFGMLAQVLWTVPQDDSLHKKLQFDWPNLVTYCERMKKRFWPDWDTRISGIKT